MTLPEHLKDACQALRSAYPQGVPADLHAAVLRFLTKHMSFRNAADVLVEVTGGDRVRHLNDLYGAAALAEDPPELASVDVQLRASGWRDE